MTPEKETNTENVVRLTQSQWMNICRFNKHKCKLNHNE